SSDHNGIGGIVGDGDRSVHVQHGGAVIAGEAHSERDVRHILATQQELGEAAGLSPSAAARRQKALEDAGILRGYRADVNLRKLGMGATVMVTITLDSQSEEAMAAFEAAVGLSPSIIRCHLMSGRNDYLLVVRAASIEDYEVIHRQEIARLPRVARIETAFALREVVNRTVPPRLLE
ncbi:MAG: Lrp/AsnC family transcriptional regulator, partial [Usitatibacteraceae bacterium]